MNERLIDYQNGHCIDHIAVGVPDTKQGIQSSPEAAELNSLFNCLGIDVLVKNSKSYISIDFKSPKGLVTIEGEGINYTGINAIFMMVYFF